MIYDDIKDFLCGKQKTGYEIRSEIENEGEIFGKLYDEIIEEYKMAIDYKCLPKRVAIKKAQMIQKQSELDRDGCYIENNLSICNLGLVILGTVLGMNVTTGKDVFGCNGFVIIVLALTMAYLAEGIGLRFYYGKCRTLGSAMALLSIEIDIINSIIEKEGDAANDGLTELLDEDLSSCGSGTIDSVDLK